MVASVFVVVPMGTARASEPPTVFQASARASVLYSVVDAQPAFDPAVIDARSELSNIGTSSLSSVAWPSFLVDAFFFLYGFQSVERVGLGIAEARYPQGPTVADATQSNLLFANVGDSALLPGKVGRAHGEADREGTHGDAAAGLITLPGATIGSAAATSSVSADGLAASARATQALKDVSAGPLRIASIAGDARVSIDRSSPTTATQHLTIVGATVGTTPVIIDGDGVRAQSAAAQDQVNDALRAAGVHARIAPASTSTGEVASASNGGVLIEVHQSATDPTGTPRNVELRYLLGSARVAARGTTLEAGPGPNIDERVTVQLPDVTIPGTQGAPAGSAGVGGDGATKIARRTIVIAGVLRIPIDASGAYLALMLAAFGLVLIKPLLRAASRA